jgi:hypothetical protein
MKKLKIKAAVAFVTFFIFVLRRTYRIRVFGQEWRKAAIEAHPAGSFCMALWHEYLFAGILTHAGQKIAPLASLSADGEIVTRVMDRLGYRTVRGSSHRGGSEARDDLVDVSQEGWFTAITLDGPRGPRRRVKGGAVDIARRSGVCILPMTAAADREWILTRTWDQFRIPKPFARIAVQYGEPLTVGSETQGLAFGAAKQALRTRLDQSEHLAREQLAAWIPAKTTF